jgi:hypothetical protein
MRKVGAVMVSLLFILLAQLAFAQTDQTNEIRCASGTACGAGAIPKFATNGGSATVNNSIIRQASGKIGVGTSTPTERLDLGNGGNVVIKTDPGSDTAQSNVAYKLIGRDRNGGATTWAIYTAPVGGGFGVPPNSLSIWQYPSSGSPGCCLQRLTIEPSTSFNTTVTPVSINGFGILTATELFSNLSVSAGANVFVGQCLYVNGATYAGNCPSDLHWKEDIHPFPPLLDKVVQLQPVSYKWRRGAPADEHLKFRSSGRASGLIAQDVEKVLPDMVSRDKRGFKTVNYSELPYLMLQAIRELKAENDSLKAESADLRNRIQRLESARSK